jgi:hypothetical protein
VLVGTHGWRSPDVAFTVAVLQIFARGGWAAVARLGSPDRDHGGCRPRRLSHLGGIDTFCRRDRRILAGMDVELLVVPDCPNGPGSSMPSPPAPPTRSCGHTCKAPATYSSG